MPQLPHAPFEQPAQPPAFAAQDFTQQITNGIRDGLVNFAREAEQIRPTNDYYVNQYTEQPSAAASAVPASAPTPTPTPTPKPKRTSTPKPTTTTTPKRTEPHEGFTYADLFPDTKDAPLREQRPPEFIRPEFTPDNIPPPIPHKAELPPTEEPAAAAASAAEEEKDIVEYAADALKQSADPEKDEYAGFTSAKAVQRAKDYMALGGDRSLKDLAIDGTFLGKRSKAYRSGTGGAAATQKAPQKKTDKPKSTFGSGLEYLN
jgi:hypothetical protein